jgi:hypothetical protein
VSRGEAVETMHELWVSMSENEVSKAAIGLRGSLVEHTKVVRILTKTIGKATGRRSL